MSTMASNPVDAPDSPSRQLLYEMSRLHLAQQEQFLERLDRENEEREKEHMRALAEAAQQHDKVRQSVELERQRLEVQIQAERERRDAENRRAIEAQRREKAERDLEEKRREVERQRLLEAEQHRDAELEKQRTQQIEATKAREARAAKEAQDREAEARRNLDSQQRTVPASPQQRPAQETQTPRPLQTQPNGITTNSTTPQNPPPSKPTPAPQPMVAPQTNAASALNTDPQVEDEHNRFLEIHKQLKSMRKFVAAEGKKDRALKEKCGDIRRVMRKSVGQLIEGKGQNRLALQNIITALKEASAITTPSIPIATFLLSPPSNISPSSEGPALLIYALNIFSKFIITQWVDEAGVSPKAADPVGIIASHVFALEAFLWHTHSLIPILLSKLHKTCPLLFGIYGPESTEAGKRRLGWWSDESGWLPRQRHYERMTGLASGFAALSLRNYEKAKLTNPFPDHHYWTALARIANTPTRELTQTHFVVLKGMVEHYEGKFIGFYGGAAVAALRVVLVDLPNRLPQDQRGGVAVKGIQALVEVLKRDSKLLL